MPILMGPIAFQQGEHSTILVSPVRKPSSMLLHVVIHQAVAKLDLLMSLPDKGGKDDFFGNQSCLKLCNRDLKPVQWLIDSQDRSLS